MPSFNITAEPIELRLNHPFGISRATKTSVTNVLVTLAKDDYRGIGEAAPNARYNEDVQRVQDYIKQIPDVFFDDVASLEQLSQKLDRFKEYQPEVKSARAALETAWADWHAQTQGQPLWQQWHHPSPQTPETSFTIGLDAPATMQQKMREAAEYPLYKVKLGTADDRAIITSLREVTDKPIRVDANEGWQTLDEARTMVDFLSDKNIEMIEQPMPARCSQEMEQLKRHSTIPLCADESFEGHESVAELAHQFSIFNVKLAKVGSLWKARQIIEKAKSEGLQVMVGCMIESSIGIAAAALLSLNAHFADLDGHLLISNDVAEGLTVSPQKRLQLSMNPGLGIKRI